MKAEHRPTAGHEHEFEAAPGLPELLPAGEHLLWQGSPSWQVLARRAFHLRKLMVYFAIILGLRGAFVLSDGGSAVDALRSMAWLLPLAAIALGILAALAYLSARSTLYTITNKRVVMRIGIVLTLTFNLPFKRIASAGLLLDADGCGDIPLVLAGSDRIAWLNLWPHARPWRIKQPEPMLRCVPQAAEVARTLANAWSAATGLNAAPTPSAVSAVPTGAAVQPVFATH